METAQAEQMQASFRALSLQPKPDNASVGAERVLLGKIMSTRPFRRFSTAECAFRQWRVRAEFKVEQVGENIFQFTFSNKEDRDQIFRQRPWTFNGSHLILKEWNLKVPIEKISFMRSTFMVQIHGLPPVFLHEGTARQIGNLIGDVDETSLLKRVVVSARFLRFRVEVLVEQPLPAGYFLELEGGEETWIQFKYERLADFCYRYGMLNHVTGKCHSEMHATMKSSGGLEAQIYGPWLKAEVNGGAVLTNSTVNRQRPKGTVQLITDTTVTFTHACTTSSHAKHKTDQQTHKRGKETLSEKECQSAGETLITTIPSIDLMQSFNFDETICQRFKNQGLNMGDITKWATQFLNIINNGGEVHSDQHLSVAEPSLNNSSEESHTARRKRAAQVYVLEEEEEQEEQLDLGLGLLKLAEEGEGPNINTPTEAQVQLAETQSPNAGTGVHHQHRYATRPTNSKYSWKRAARSRGRGDRQNTQSRGETSERLHHGSQDFI